MKYRYEIRIREKEKYHLYDFHCEHILKKVVVMESCGVVAINRTMLEKVFLRRIHWAEKI